MKKVLILSETAPMLISSIEKLLGPNEKKTISIHDNLNLDEADLIFIDYTLVSPEVLKHKTKLAIMSSLAEPEVVNRILYETGVKHLFGLSGPSSLSDIRNFIVCWLENKRWTAQTFMPNPVKTTTHAFVTSAGAKEKIEELIAEHDLSGCFDGMDNYLLQIIDEALSNALYNAPVDGEGKHLFSHLSRTEVVNMIPGKEPLVAIHTDNKSVVISVKDFYGSLKENQIFDFLPQGEVREKAGGAGIGMFLIFKYAHKFIINLEPGIMTENLIIIENDKRFKNYDLKEKSFHFFHTV